MRTLNSVILILGTIFSSYALGAPCVNMQLQTGQTNIDFTSNPQFQGTFTVKANTNPGGCDFFIVFDYGYSSSYVNRSLKMSGYEWPYQVYKDSAGVNIIKNVTDASSNSDILSGTLPDGNNDAQVNVSYWAALNMTNPWLRFGNYTEYISAHLYRGTLSNYSFVSSRLISLNYNAPKRVDVSMVASGGAFVLGDTDEVMNFGTLSAGATRSASAVMKYNAGYTLYVSSTNGGRLKHQTDAQYIPYTIKFNNDTVGLTTSPQQLYRVFGVSPASGTSIPITVTIGNFGNVKAGAYSDQVQLTIETTE
ncbi:spore coat protein U domain-containing protein [Bdellovibrio svalbardensis]|uniref:Spore coat protein U domain-containing protein n=1 Tax=Bdellovibrio svalbardensis TaxID=2972972 RepID=A0ABT6DDZ2_9BACT|nr:hypothetical protein [Bdellovibrio svalbardensis]MDG0814749.1 hypothetical protein [Bdellovibrio svalbardensis]